MCVFSLTIFPYNSLSFFPLTTLPYNQKSLYCECLREYEKLNLQGHCLTYRIDLHPVLCTFALLIDMILDNNKPLIAMNAVLGEMEMRKALN